MEFLTAKFDSARNVVTPAALFNREWAKRKRGIRRGAAGIMKRRSATMLFPRMRRISFIPDKKHVLGKI